MAHMWILKAASQEAPKECFESYSLWNPGARPALSWPYLFWWEYECVSHGHSHACPVHADHWHPRVMFAGCRLRSSLCSPPSAHNALCSYLSLPPSICDAPALALTRLQPLPGVLTRSLPLDEDHEHSSPRAPRCWLSTLAICECALMEQLTPKLPCDRDTRFHMVPRPSLVTLRASRGPDVGEEFLSHSPCLLAEIMSFRLWD